MTNQQLYDLTKCEPWSIVSERRRLSWLGHMMRLNPETPARQSFKEAQYQRREAWQTPNDMDNNNSKIPERERHLHKSAPHKFNQRTRVDVQ